MPSVRAYDRIAFPLGTRPWLLVGDHVYPVVDCSERGLRFVAEPERRPEAGGEVRLPTGEDQKVTGFVLRHTPDGAALLARRE